MSENVIDIEDILGIRGKKPPEKAQSPDPWRRMTTAQIFEELPPYPWLIKGLHLAPGRISLLNGYANAGKTVVAMSIALAVATGTKVWGVFSPARAGKVLHLNGEIGSFLARERYQRLARGLGIDVTSLVASGQLELSNYALPRLDDADFEEKLIAACTGCVLVIVDSLRVFSGKLDENAKEIGVAILKLARVSEATGATILVLHHNRKTNDSGGGVKEAISGSSSIFGGAECAFVMEQKVKGGPIVVYHERSPIGRPLADFGLVVEDVQNGNDPRWGLRVVHLEPEQLEEREEQAKRASADRETSAASKRILETLTRYAGCYRGSRESLRTECRVGKAPLLTAINELLQDGRIIQGGTYHQPEWRLP